MPTELLFALVATLAGCAAPSSGAAERLQASLADAPAEIRDTCRLMVRRCTRCHSLDRVMSTRVEHPDHWRTYVHRMRLMSGSGIRPDEERPISRCLIYHSFGEDIP